MFRWHASHSLLLLLILCHDFMANTIVCPCDRLDFRCTQQTHETTSANIITTHVWVFLLLVITNAHIETHWLQQNTDLSVFLCLSVGPLKYHFVLFNLISWTWKRAFVVQQQWKREAERLNGQRVKLVVSIWGIPTDDKWRVETLFVFSKQGKEWWWWCCSQHSMHHVAADLCSQINTQRRIKRTPNRIMKRLNTCLK